MEHTPTIDLHAHLIDLDAVGEMQRTYPDVAPRLVDHDGKRRMVLHDRGHQNLPGGLCDPRRRLADMDRTGVDVQALTLPPSQLHYHLDAEPGAAFASINNDAFLAVCDRHPDRFVTFATLPLQDADASIKEIRRLEGNRHVRGIGIGSTVAGVDLDADHLEPVWEALEAADLPVWVHPDYRSMGSMGGDRLWRYYLQNNIGNPMETTIALASIIHSGVLERYPALRFGFVHGGGFAPYQVRRWNAGWERHEAARERIPDHPPSDYFEKMYFDTLTHDTVSLRMLAEYVGWQHIVVGSDYPMSMGSEYPLAIVERLRLPGEVERQVLTGNAERFMRSL